MVMYLLGGQDALIGLANLWNFILNFKTVYVWHAFKTMTTLRLHSCQHNFTRMFSHML
jgi:hypothetical protein